MLQIDDDVLEDVCSIVWLEGKLVGVVIFELVCRLFCLVGIVEVDGFLVFDVLLDVLMVIFEDVVCVFEDDV